jgi:hypothetical protein
MSESIILDCPFCHQKTISAIHYPPVLQTKVTLVGSNRSTSNYYTKEKTEITSGCSNCGKSQKEIQKALKNGNEDVEKEKKIFERLKAQGIVKDEMTTKF